MALNNVELPIEYFADPVAGRPVFFADIYIGEPDTDPELPGNQKQVTLREESGNEVQIAQPVNTGSGGVPMYNGSPVQILVDGNYSIKVLDRNGTQVYYVPDYYVAIGIKFLGASIVFDVVADMVASPVLMPGNKAQTLGYYTVGDGGGNFYKIVNAGTGINDGGSFIDLDVFQAEGIFFDGIYNDHQFGTVGDGVANDTFAMTAFFNSAINNNGAPHRIDVGIYQIDAKMPVINKSSVKIMGAGSRTLDIGDYDDKYTVLKWIGTTGQDMVEIASISGSSNAVISNVEFTGILIDCKEIADNGLLINSLTDSEIDITVFNAVLNGLNMNVVSELGEAKDNQFNNIKFQGRQFEARNGVSMRLGGDSLANTSFNRIDADIAHTDEAGIICDNTDNNYWPVIRLFGAGTSNEGIRFMGGVDDANTSRNERIGTISSAKSIRAYGTGDGFNSSAKDIQIYNIDVSNGTQRPVIGEGATVYYHLDFSPWGDAGWIEYTPIVTAASGTIGSYTATGRYLVKSEEIDYQFNVVIDDQGTGDTALIVSLPPGFVAVHASGYSSSGIELAVVGKGITGWIQGSIDTIKFSDGTFPGLTGANIVVSGFYGTA